jgi:hypothetical protein
VFCDGVKTGLRAGAATGLAGECVGCKRIDDGVVCDAGEEVAVGAG